MSFFPVKSVLPPMVISNHVIFFWTSSSLSILLHTPIFLSFSSPSEPYDIHRGLLPHTPLHLALSLFTHLFSTYLEDEFCGRGVNLPLFKWLLRITLLLRSVLGLGDTTWLLNCNWCLLNGQSICCARPVGKSKVSFLYTRGISSQ